MTEFSVQNMTCGHCVSAVTQAVRSIDPAAVVQVDLAAARVRVGGAGDVARLVSALEEAGYPAAPVTGDAPAVARKSGCCGSCG